MDFAAWLTEFRALHQHVREGAASPEERRTYAGARAELARALVAANKVAVGPGETAEEVVRGPCAVQVDLESPTWKVRATTIELWARGFTALLARPPPADEKTTCSIRVPGGEPVIAAVRSSATRTQPGSARVAFTFTEIDAADRERLQDAVFDALVAQLTR